MRRMLRATALALLMALRVSVAQAESSAVEAAVQRHLQWLSGCDNFRAGVVVTDGLHIITGTLLYDTQSRKTLLLMRHDGLPRKLNIKATRTGPETALLAFSLGWSRPDDLPFDIKSFGFSPFGAGIPDLFVRGDSLDATMERMRTIGDDIVVETPALGTMTGLRISLKKSLFDSLMLAADEMLAGDKSIMVLPPDYITLWFEEDGRLAAIVLTRDDKAFDLEARFEYEEINMDLGAFEQLVADAGPPARPALPVGPDQLAMADNVVEPMLGHWALMAVSGLMLAVSLGVIVRLRSS